MWFHMKSLILALALVLTTAVTSMPVQAQGGDPVVNFSDDDAAMNAAMAGAQQSLPIFMDALNNPGSGATDLILKVAIATDTDYVEHIWVDQIRPLGDDRFEGRYANDPVEFKGNQGDPVTFSQASISDWSFMENGKFHGNYTTRVMLPHFDPDYATALSSLLAPLPEVTP